MALEPEVLIQHAGFLRRLARPLVADEATLDDVLQETWLAALKRPPREMGALRSWLARVTLNAALKVGRSDMRRRRREETGALPESVPSGESACEQRELARLVVDAVFDLDEPYRRVVLLRYFEDLSLREVARREGLKVETARTRLKRAVHQLRERLDAEHDGRRQTWVGGLAALTGVEVAGAATVGLFGIGLRWAVAALMVVGVGAGLWWISTDAAGVAGQTSAQVGEELRATSPDLDRSTADEVRDLVVAETAIGDEYVSGVIVDPRGNPVKGARVMVLPDDLDQPIAVDAGPFDENMVHQTTTDAAGAFRLQSLPDHHMTLYADAPGYSEQTRWIPREGDLGEIVLSRPRALYGIVRDLEEQPVADAVVTWKQIQDGAYREFSTVSGVDGSYRIDRAGDMATKVDSADAYLVQILVEAEGFAPLEVNHPDALYGEGRVGDIRFDLYLPRGATIRGSVIDAETGRGILDAALRIESWGASGTSNIHSGDFDVSPIHSQVLARATTDASGGFLLERVPAWGVHRLTGDAPEFGSSYLGVIIVDGPGYSERHISIDIPDEGSVLKYTIGLARAAEVSGRVVDERGQGIPGADVWIRLTDKSLEDRHPALRTGVCARATTDSEGRFHCCDVPAPRSVPVEASVEMSHDAYSRPSETPSIRVRAGSRNFVPDTCLAPRPVGAWVRVQNSEGNPIHGAYIMGHRTDRQGLVGLPWRRQGYSGRLAYQVNAPGYRTWHTPGIRLSIKDPPEVTVTMERRTAIVRQPRPAPPATTRVKLIVRDAADGQPVLRLQDARLKSSGGTASWPRPIRPGVFEFAGVSLGSWSLTVKAEGYARHQPLSIDLTEMNQTEQVVLELSRGLTMSGCVRTAEGSVLERAELILHPLGEGQFRQLWLDREGCFEAGGFLPGETYRVAAWTDGHMVGHACASDFVLRIPSDDGQPVRDLVVHPAGSIRVKSDVDLSAPSTLSLFDLGGHLLHCATVTSNIYTSITVPFGSYRVLLERPDGPAREAWVTVEESGEKKIVLQL